MPPRTTQQSHRPRVSDRTMVGDCQPAACRRKEAGQRNAKGYDAKNLPKRWKREPCPRKECGGCRQGLDVKKNIFPGRSGEVFFLDIPFYRTRQRAPRKLGKGQRPTV